MIEMIYKENGKEAGVGKRLELPKNIRQIGEPEENRKIYIEDYVVTYLKKIAKEAALNSRVAVLLGNSEWMDGIPYLFIKSAVALKNLEDYGDGIPFTDEAWAEVYGAIKEYFAEQDVLGWFLSIPGYPMDLDPGLVKTHINHFGGVDKVLMVAEPMDGEEDFFAYENGRLARQRGYYIFYERNESMQRYMVETGDGESIEVKEEFEDRATRNFRTLVREKKDLSGQKRVMTFLYTASTFLVMVVLVIGITLINNYEKMEGLEMTLTEISQSLENQEGQVEPDTENQEGDQNQQLVAAMEKENIEAQEEIIEEPEEPERPEESEEPEEPEEPVETEKQEEMVSQEEQVEEPKEQEMEPESAEVAISQNVVSVPESYTVQKGDTLLKISRKIYGKDNKIDEICSLNGIKDINHILVGQKLLLP